MYNFTRPTFFYLHDDTDECELSFGNPEINVHELLHH